jgi:transcriptional regulator with XRE-family HTH domain
MLPMGYQIYQKRLSRKMTQADLARQAGIPQPNLSDIEKGKRDLTVSTLRRIAYGLRMEMIDFFRPESKHPQKQFQLPWTRSRLERIAFAIAKGEPKSRLSVEERELVQAFRAIIPEIRKGRLSVKKINDSWLKLKYELNSSTINQIMNRVRDSLARAS